MKSLIIASWKAGCLRAGVRGLSSTIQVFSIVSRFLEHSRIYRFENGGHPEFYLGSADWMRRNFDGRMETVAPVTDPAIRAELERILDVYESDNTSAWDMQPDGHYVRRRPASGQPPRGAQQLFIQLAAQALFSSGAECGRVEIALGDLVSEERRDFVLLTEVLPLPLLPGGELPASLEGEELLSIEFLWTAIGDTEIKTRIGHGPGAKAYRQLETE